MPALPLVHGDSRRRNPNRVTFYGYGYGYTMGPVPATLTTFSRAASRWLLPAHVATYWNVPQLTPGRLALGRSDPCWHRTLPCCCRAVSIGPKPTQLTRPQLSSDRPSLLAGMGPAGIRHLLVSDPATDFLMLSNAVNAEDGVSGMRHRTGIGLASGWHRTGTGVVERYSVLAGTRWAPPAAHRCGAQCDVCVLPWPVTPAGIGRCRAA